MASIAALVAASDCVCGDDDAADDELLALVVESWGDGAGLVCAGAPAAVELPAVGVSVAAGCGLADGAGLGVGALCVVGAAGWD